MLFPCMCVISHVHTHVVQSLIPHTQLMTNFESSIYLSSLDEHGIALDSFEKAHLGRRLFVHDRHCRAHFFPRFASRKRTCFRTMHLSASHLSTCLPFHIFRVASSSPGPLCPVSLLGPSSRRPPHPPLPLLSLPLLSLPLLLGGAVCKKDSRTNRIILEHTQRAMRARPHKRPVVARHGHGNEAHHYGAGFCCSRPSISICHTPKLLVANAVVNR